MHTTARHLRFAVEIQDDLRRLYVERALAEIAGLDADEGYMADLLDDIAAHRGAYAGAAACEIAMLRARIDGPLQG